MVLAQLSDFGQGILNASLAGIVQTDWPSMQGGGRDFPVVVGRGVCQDNQQSVFIVGGLHELADAAESQAVSVPPCREIVEDAAGLAAKLCLLFPGVLVTAETADYCESSET